MANLPTLTPLKHLTATHKGRASSNVRDTAPLRDSPFKEKMKAMGTNFNDPDHS